MGFFGFCVDFIVQFALTPFNAFRGTAQTPLSFSEAGIQLVNDAPSPTSYSYASYPTLSPRDCRYPALEELGFRMCNDEHNRDCWLQRDSDPNPIHGRWDVNTNYERVYPPGTTREYWVTVNATPDLSPDGHPKIGGVTFNGQYPGPIIEACWGDRIIVHVKNMYPDNGTTIHWHGIRQLGSNEMDGVNGVTQCPIPYNQTYTYDFIAMQYGHTWYHSHYSLQYPDGVAGPLVIHGPTSEKNWDIDLEPILMADWVHDTAFKVFDCEAYGCGQPGPPQADSIVINGVGRYNATTGGYYNITFTPGKRHLLRLINGSSGASFVFSIDNHTMEVVASDLVPVENNYMTDSLFIGIGQRYTVIVEANQQPSLYWIRTAPAAGCSAFVPGVTVSEQTAMVIYDGAPPLSQPPSTSVKQGDVTYACDDESEYPNRLVPKVKWIVEQHPINNVTFDSFEAGMQDTPDKTLVPNKPYQHWVLASDTSFKQPLWVDFSNPTILDPQSRPDYSAILQFNQSHGFIYLIVDASGLKNVKGIQQIGASHPIHLHGSDFVVLAQSKTAYNVTESPKHFNFNNPPRRDVAMLPGGGYLALAFKPDNPGAWLMHCHIAWHASSGLALQLVVRPDDILDRNGPLKPVKQVCQQWKDWVSGGHPVTQEDSGI